MCYWMRADIIGKVKHMCGTGFVSVVVSVVPKQRISPGTRYEALGFERLPSPERWRPDGRGDDSWHGGRAGVDLGILTRVRMVGDVVALRQRT